MNEARHWMRFSHLRCKATAEGDYAEPYLWSVFIKLDGTNITQSKEDLKKLIPSIAPHFGHPGPSSLGVKKMTENQVVEIPPPTGSFRTSLVPMNIDTVTNGIVEVPGMLIGIALVMESDGVTDRGMLAAHEAFKFHFSAQINRFFAELNLLDVYNKANELAIKDNLSIEDAFKAELEARFNAFQPELTALLANVMLVAIVNKQNYFENVATLVDPDDRIGQVIIYKTSEEMSNEGVSWGTKILEEGESELDIGIGSSGKKGKYQLSWVISTKHLIPFNELPPEEELRILWCDKFYSQNYKSDIVSGIGGYSPTMGYWRMSKKMAIKVLREKQRTMYVQQSVHDPKTRIILRDHPFREGMHYITTVPDRTTDNNLLSLPNPPYYLEDL